MAENQAEYAPSVQQSVKSFFQERGFVEVNKHVNQSELGRPFITCIDGNNKAENIWFSTKASAFVQKGDVINRELMDKLNIWHGKNADGENRTKFCLKGENRTSVEDLF